MEDSPLNCGQSLSAKTIGTIGINNHNKSSVSSASSTSQTTSSHLCTPTPNLDSLLPSSDTHNFKTGDDMDVPVLPLILPKAK